MPWKYFGPEAIRFTRYDLVLEELAQALSERIGYADGYLCPPGTKLSIEEAVELMKQLEPLDNTSYFNPFERSENSTNIPYRAFYCKDILAHYNMDIISIKQPFKRLFDPMWAFQRQLIIDAMRWRKYTFKNNITAYAAAKKYGLRETGSFEECCSAVRTGEPTEERIRAAEFYMDRSEERYSIRLWVSAFEIKDYDRIRFKMALYSKIFSTNVEYDRFHPVGPIEEPDKSYLLRSVDDSPDVHPIITEEQRANLKIIRPENKTAYNIDFQMSPVFCYDCPGGFEICNQNFYVIPT